MKKVNISISYDEEKTSTLKLYLEQKSLSLEEELEKCIDTLYGKYVPVQVQTFIAMRSGSAVAVVETPKPRSRRKSTPPQIEEQISPKPADLDRVEPL